MQIMFRVLIGFEDCWGEVRQMEVDVLAPDATSAVDNVLQNVQVDVVGKDEEYGIDE